MPSKRKSSACVDYVPALCTHRPSLLPIEWLSEASGAGVPRNWDSGKTGQTWSFRGSKSRNKVSVGEPAEGSLSIFPLYGEANENLGLFALGSRPACRYPLGQFQNACGYLAAWVLLTARSEVLCAK